MLQRNVTNKYLYGMFRRLNINVSRNLRFQVLKQTIDFERTEYIGTISHGTVEHGTSCGPIIVQLGKEIIRLL
jgi:hypothetical protein